MTAQVYIAIFIVLSIVVTLISIKTTYASGKQDLAEKIKLDIELKQMIQIEKNISSFYVNNNLKDDVDLEKIASILGVKRGGNKDGLLEQACLEEVNSCGDKMVFFKHGLSEKEEQFAYAHELAHILNGDTIPATRPDARHKTQIEQIADYTAAALLMPIDTVYKYLEEERYVDLSARKRTAIIRKLCKKYDVTEVIALRRVKEVFAIKKQYM